MTNREHMMKQIEKMSDEEFCAFLENHDRPWCYGKTCTDNMHCTDCRKKWAEATYKEPMPELRVGMFVKVRHYIFPSPEDYIGVITLDENDNNVIVYKETTWDFVASVKNNIIAVYNASCFIDCDDEHCIWRA